MISVPECCAICDHLIWDGDWGSDYLICELDSKVDSEFINIHKHYCEKFTLHEDLVRK